MAEPPSSHVEDEFLGPQLWPQFNFTLLFEHTVLTILPASLLIIGSAIYLFRHFKSTVYISGSIILWAKLAMSGMLLSIETANLVLWAVLPIQRTSASLAAASLAYIASIFIGIVINLEHRNSSKRSTFFSLFIGLTLLLDVAKGRSQLSRPNTTIVGALSAATAAVKLSLLLLDEVSRRRHVKDPTLRRSLRRERASGFWDRLSFIRLNYTLLVGFRNILTMENLYDLDFDLSADYLATTFKPIWKQYKHSSYALIRACLVTLTVPFFSVMIPRLLFIGFSFSQPFLLRSIVSFIGKDDQSPSERNSLIGATIIIYTGQAITRASYNHLNCRLVTRLRGVLVSEIFKKTLLLEHENAKEFAAATLMSTDIEGISEGIPKFHELWASILELGLGLYFLSTTVGAAAFLVLFPAILSTVAGVILGNRMAPARVTWNSEIQNRVSITAGALHQLKNIKMIGQQSAVAGLIQQLRESEMKLSKKFRLLYVILRATVMMCYQITPVVVIAAALFWTRLSGGLHAVHTFPTLAFLVLTALPLVKIMLSYTTITTTLACFRRIESYLLLNELQDERESISDLVLRATGGHDEGSSPEKQATKKMNRPCIRLMLPQPPILFVGASIAAASGKDPILKNVNISITRTELAVVLGRTGSGKSTLLRAILGEATVTDGLVYAEHRRIAYCDQSPWLRDISIKKNIIGEDIPTQSIYDREWYDMVLDACLLLEDLRQLPEGDSTKAGTGGVKLSGGQRQRIALARAVYSQASILILDNVFSALDKTTSDAIFHRLLGSNGLLRRIGKTVVMSTNKAEHVTAADRLLLIDGQGFVKCMRNRPEVDFQDLISSLNGTDTVYDEDFLKDDGGKTDDQVALKGKALLRQQGDFGLYSFYLKSVSKWLWILFLVAVILVTVCQRLPEIFIRIWLDVAPDNKSYMLGYILLSTSCSIFTLFTLSLFYLKMVPKSSENLHRSLLDAVMGSTLTFLSSRNVGSLLNLFSQDMNLVSQELPIQFFLFLWAVILLLTDMVIIASGATYVAIVIPFFIFTLYLIQRFYLRTSRQMLHLDLEAKTPLYTQFTEIASGLPHIRSFGWRGKYRSQSLSLLDYSQKPFYYMFYIQRWLGLVTDLYVLGIAIILVSVALCVEGTTSENAIGLALLNLMQFGDSARNVIDYWVNLETSLGAIARLRTVIQETPREHHGISSIPPGCLEKGAIELIGVTSTYNSSSLTSKAALRNVTLDIKPGQKVAVLGRTGSGKSSLILTLLNFLDYTGVIRFDGVDMADIPPQYLRSRITTISQDVVDLPGSVRDNLALGTKGSEMDDKHNDGGVLFDVLQEVGLLEYIDSHGGLDSPLTNMGFSHGQKQLLAIARAMIQKQVFGNRILLVDEATSSMDGMTAAAMHRVLEEAFSDCTVISISHSPETVENVDIVVTIDDSRVVSVVRKR